MGEADFQTSITELRQADLLNPRACQLNSFEAHVWEFPIIGSDDLFASCRNLLAEDERQRASRFHFEKDSRRFTIARGIVRSILGAYVPLPARDIRFLCAHHGKPAIANAATDLRFNVSHSRDMALLGVAHGREIGVDIEAIRPEVETDKLAERFFSVQERDTIRSLPPERRVAAFFRCWTSKEAFLKAQGVGLSRSLGSFDVEVDPEKPACLLATRPDALEAGAWRLHEIPTDSGYAAAAAVEGTVDRIKLLHSNKS